MCHKCDVPGCVNPKHLFLGSDADNNVDMRNKMRHAYGEKHGNAKLSLISVRNIKRDYAKGFKSMAVVANKYGISTMQVCRIINRQRWSF